MRELMVTTFVSLDGVMQAPGGPEEDPSENFTLGGWSATQWDDVMGGVMGETLDRPFDLLLGRRTYDIFAGFWPQSTDEGAAPLNRATKYVVSRGKPDLPWETSVLVEGGADGVAALKRTDGPQLQVHGSGDLIQTLLTAGLIDRLRVWTFPVLLGSGRRLFAGGTVPAALRLTDSVVSSTGVVIATYEPAGEVRIGRF